MEKRSSEDRRRVEIDFRRRKLNRRKREYLYQREIYLSDTNAYQNVYFANFVYYLGEAREDFLDWMLGENKAGFMRSGVGLVTVDCSIKYLGSLYVFDIITVRLTVPKMTRTKLHFNFEIINFN